MKDDEQIKYQKKDPNLYKELNETQMSTQLKKYIRST